MKVLGFAVSRGVRNGLLIAALIGTFAEAGCAGAKKTDYDQMAGQIRSKLNGQIQVSLAMGRTGGAILVNADEAEFLKLHILETRRISLPAEGALAAREVDVIEFSPKAKKVLEGLYDPNAEILTLVIGVQRFDVILGTSITENRAIVKYQWTYVLTPLGRKLNDELFYFRSEFNTVHEDQACFIKFDTGWQFDYCR